MIRQAWGFAPNPSRTRARFRATARPLHLNRQKTNGFPKALGLWSVPVGAASRRDGKALALPSFIGQSPAFLIKDAVRKCG